MENLILTATFSGPPTLLHLPHKFTNVKKPKPGFELTRDAKWLTCVTLFPVSVCSFILFLHQDFQGKQHWLSYGHFQTLRAGVSLSAQARVIRLARAPPCHKPHASQLSVETCTPTRVCRVWETISTTFCLETRTVFEKFFKCTNVIIRRKHFWNRIGWFCQQEVSIPVSNLLLVHCSTLLTRAQHRIPRTCALLSAPPSPTHLRLPLRHHPHGHRCQERSWYWQTSTLTANKKKTPKTRRTRSFLGP